MTVRRRAPRILTCLLLFALLTAMLALPAGGAPPEKVRVLVRFATLPGAAQEALVKSAGGTINHTFHVVPAIAATLPETALGPLSSNPHILAVEPDLPMCAVDIVQDAELANAWGVSRIDVVPVHASDNRGEGVSVAVVDSGVNRAHLDLANNYRGGIDVVDGDGDPTDVYGHGTHVAGTICGEDNDNGEIDSATGDRYGVVGVAPACDLYAVRVLDDNGYGYASWLIEAMEWCILNGIDVANLSLGWDRDPGATVHAVFDAAQDAGMVVVAAAGNSGNRPGKGESVIYPAAYDTVIAVAAVDSSDARASFSSTGDAVELAAPGVAVLSTWNDGDSLYDPQPMCRDANDCYKYGSGTSMASPHVAGVAALVIASGVTDQNSNDGFSDEVRQILTSTAEDLGSVGRDPQYGYGLVNAAAAVGASPPPPEPVYDIAVTAIDTDGAVTLGAQVDVEVTVANVGTETVTTDIVVTLTDATDTRTIGSQIVPGGLEPSASATLGFLWDTSDASLGAHTLVASHDCADDDVANNTGSVEVIVNDDTQTLSVSSIDPAEILTGSSQGVTVVGTGFVVGASLTFEGGIGAAPTASDLAVAPDGTEITGTLAIKDGGPPKTRFWDVRVTNPDGSTAALEGGLVVLP